MKITPRAEEFRLAETFTISRGSRDVASVLIVSIEDGAWTGHGECVPYARYGETMDGVAAAISEIEPPVGRMALQELMPPGAARNALDCALWDLEAKAAGRRVWDIAGLQAPKPVETAFTLSLDSPDRMEAAARRHAQRPLLKIKLGGGDDDMARLEAVRRGAPTAPIIVDANEGWTADLYSELAPHLVRLGVKLVEQPLPVGGDDLLSEIERPLPVCADESCHDRASLPGLSGKYDVVNIKLDKTGGLTEALALRAEAQLAGFGIMVGCMVGTSLAMAPALLVAQGVGYVDLDGPLLLAEDRAPPLAYDADGLHPPEAALWG